MPLICQSRIHQVTVHARGALVQRRVALPAELPAGDLTICLPDITLFADGGSVRARARGGRSVVAAKVVLAVPEAPQPVAQAEQALRELEARVERLGDEQRQLSERRAKLLGLALDPGLKVRALPGAGPGPREDPPRRERDAEDDAGREDLQADVRTADALGAQRMLDGLVADLDQRLQQAQEALRLAQEALQAARVQRAQQSDQGRRHSGQATQQIEISLSGQGALEELLVSYVVPGARWWPLYTLRMVDAGQRAVLLVEALVAQRSGEDWGGVRLSLSTADLVSDARLPELPSLRLSRAQPPPRRGYRPPPEGLERLFAGYDRVFGAAPPPPLPEPVPRVSLPSMPPLPKGGAAPRQANYAPARDEGGAVADGAPMDQEEITGRHYMAEQAMPPPPQSAPMPARAGGPPGGPPPAPAMMMPVASMVAMPEMAKRRSSVMASGAAALGGMLQQGFGGGGAPPAPPLEAPAPIEPAEGWLDFDALRLGPVSDRARRGRLVRDASGERARLRQLVEQAIEALEPTLRVRDPRTTKGQFDYRYEAEGMADVPSDGQPHRLVLQSCEAQPSLRFCCVPREAKEVYRQAELHNPTDGPLLAGPVDVYVEGSLLATTEVEHVDRGGALLIGMGVEERIRLARNVRVDEEAAGMLGGSTAVTHTVTMELQSSLGRAAQVDVLDRVPVSNEKGVEIKRLYTRPEAQPYTQVERGAPLQGGLRFRVNLEPGGKGHIEFQYRLTFPAKSEIVGGNRRE